MLVYEWEQKGRSADNMVHSARFTFRSPLSLRQTRKPSVYAYFCTFTGINYITCCTRVVYERESCCVCLV